MWVHGRACYPLLPFECPPPRTFFSVFVSQTLVSSPLQWQPGTWASVYQLVLKLVKTLDECSLGVLLLVNIFMIDKICLFPFQQSSAFSTARRIIRKKGLGFDGLSKGLTATLGRHGVWNMIYFAFYHNMKVWLPEAKVSWNQGKGGPINIGKWNGYMWAIRSSFSGHFLGPETFHFKPTGAEDTKL